MTKHDGTWTVTDEGLKALEQFPDSEQFFKHARQLYLAWKKANKAPQPSTISTTKKQQMKKSTRQCP
jgi:hypothetical protein